VNNLLVAALAASVLAPSLARAQCDPVGNGRPVRFISPDRYADKVMSVAEREQTIEAWGTLPSAASGPWVWWSEAKIRAHCANKDHRGSLSVIACVTYSQHQNALSALIDLAQEMARVRDRVDAKRASCGVPAAGSIAGAKARTFWKCLGGIQLPSSFTFGITFAGDNVESLTVRGTFLPRTPSFQLTAHTTAMGCGLSAWSVEQTKPLDWPSSNSGDVPLGSVSWAP
jgi:hypothetical protein